MKLFSASLIVFALALAGCTEATKPKSSEKPKDAAPATNPDAPAPKGNAEPAPTAKADPAPKGDAGAAPKAGTGDIATAAAEVPLTPENTKIQFVGIHSGDKPDPRTGNFSKFSGTAKVDGGKLVSVKVDIDTESLTTEIEKLTNHLKSPDFFDVKQYPSAKFESTAIEHVSDGKVNITGDLTLLNETKSITFPATVSTKDGLSLKAEFEIDRTQFGMNYGADKVEKQVAMTVSIGK